MKMWMVVIGLLLATPNAATSGTGVVDSAGSSRSTACSLALSMAKLSAGSSGSFGGCRCEKDDDAFDFEKWHCEVSYSDEDSDEDRNFYESSDREDRKRDGRSAKD